MLLGKNTKYEVYIIIMLSISCLVFVFSDGLLFLSLFRVTFRSPRPLSWASGKYVPYPCELTYTDTLLLQNASLSLRCAFIREEAAVGDGGNSIISLILLWAFLPLQIREFRTSSYLFLWGCVFSTITRRGMPNNTRLPLPRGPMAH